MTKFVVGQPVVTAEPVVVVDGGISVGLHVFTLVVEDNDGNRSKPAPARVQVRIVGHPETGGPGVVTEPTHPVITEPAHPLHPPRPPG